MAIKLKILYNIKIFEGHYVQMNEGEGYSQNSAEGGGTPETALE